MKTYRISRRFVWSLRAARIVLTLAGAGLYIAAVTQPTPLPARLALLGGLATFGWLFYVRMPKMPTQIGVTPDGWVNVTNRQGTSRVHVASILSIRRSLGRRSVRLRHARGRFRFPDRFPGFYDFLSTVKGMNPGIDVRGF